jgi:hypothetical protein
VSVRWVGKDEHAIVPIDSAVREKLKLSTKLQTLVILLVDQITFADGSKYDARLASKSLIDFFVDRCFVDAYNTRLERTRHHLLLDFACPTAAILCFACATCHSAARR